MDHCKACNAIKKLKELEVKKDKLHTLLENEMQGTSKWCGILWDIDTLVEKICDLEQTL